MKKLFTLFAAMLLTVAVNADKFEITPTTWKGGTVADRTLYRTLDATQSGINPGDTIVLATGTYIESQSMNINSDVVIMAAENASPLVKMTGYFNVYDASPIVQGLTFQFVGSSGNGYGFYIRENHRNYIKLEGCEFYDHTKYIVAGEAASAHIDSCIINDCYFHNLDNGPFYFYASSLKNDTNMCDYLKVTNSTFANINVHSWVACIDLRNNNNNTKSTSTLVIDHCTFYNCKGDYERMIQSYKSPQVTVSNNIMMNPLQADTIVKLYPTYLYGGTVKNNLTYQTKSLHGATTSSGNITDTNPKFIADSLAVGKYNLADDSPAIDAGTDGKTLGDPRWWPVVTYPETDFAGGYAFTGTDAALEAGLIKEDHWGAGREYIRYDGGLHSFAAASWQVEATRACYVEVRVFTATNQWEGHTSNPYGNSGHNFSVELYDENNVRLDTLAEGVYQPSPWDGYRTYPAEGIELGTFSIPEAGVYTIRLKNMRDYSRCGVDSVLFTYSADIPTIAAKGAWDTWTDPINFTIAKDGKTATATKHFDAEKGYEFKMIVGGTYVRDDSYWHFYYKTNERSGITNDGSGNMKFWTDFEGDYIFTWTYATSTLTITYPEAVTSTTKIYYVNKDNWSSVKAYPFGPSAYIGWPGEAATLTEYTYEGHAIYSYDQPINRTKVIFVDGSNSDNKTGDLSLEDGKPYFYNGTWYASLPGVPTSIDETVVSEKAVKVIRNGQLFIEKDGKTYNVLGTVVK